MEDNTYRWPGNDPQPEKQKKKMPDIKRAAKNVLVIVLNYVFSKLVIFKKDA